MSAIATTTRRLLIGLFAVGVMAIGAPALASATTPNPMGALESVQVTAFSNAVVMTGWALDPATRSRPTSVLVSVDGRSDGAWQSTAIARTDIDKSYAATGGHGFTITTTLATGKHVVCVTARVIAATTPTVSLGCFAFQAYPAATKADMLAIAKTIDPKGTITWAWSALPTGTSGQALPWNKTIEISSANTTRYLRAMMLHEWSHVLQYRAFAGSDPWFDAVQAFNALLGHPGDRQNYDGVEHGADCIAMALGADHLGYGCPAALRTYGARIAYGVLMNRPTGTLEAVSVSGTTATVTGWAFDPRYPTTASKVQITDNGRAVTGWTVTTVTRTDINTRLGVTGQHGLTVRVALTHGSHRLCVSAAAVAPGQAAVTTGGCTVVTVG